MALPVGRFIVSGEIAETLVVTKSLTAATNSYSDIATFQTGSGQHTLFISLKDPAVGIYKQISFSVNPDHTGGLWFTVSPLEAVGDLTNNFNVEMMSDGLQITIRLRKISGPDPLSLQIVLQNLGTEDSQLSILSGTGTDSLPAAGEVSSIPYGAGAADHNQLANRGAYPHVTIDAHIDASAPHSGHEIISRKDVPGGYAGLNSNGQISIGEIPVGATPGTVCAGDDIRLQGGQTPGPHASSHTSGGSDEVSLNDLTGVLPQVKTHESADTDVATTSIHHTLGTGHTQAAPGDHTHDSEYAPIDKGIEGGDSHIHDGTTGVRIPHSNLLGVGGYTHDNIDAHIDDAAPHSGHEAITNKNMPNGYAGIGANGFLSPITIPFGSLSGTVCEGNDTRLLDARTPLAHANTHKSGSSDELLLGDLSGALPQDQTHESPDTDVSSGSLHHTLGTGSTQAAPGNHLHDGVYAPVTSGVTNGDMHDHSGGDGAQIAHSSLSGGGVFTHVEIDSHISDSSPHSGHEVKSDKGAPNGYASLDASGKLNGTAQVYGSTAATACEGNDTRLSDARTPLSHSATHAAGMTDELSLSDLNGNLAQSRTHVTPDTDAGSLSLHHTLGAGEFQAAPGNHSHVSEYDARYAPISEGVTGGNLHDHSGGDGDVIDHTNLSSKGTYTHSELDSHLDASSPHSGHELTANRSIPGGYAALDSSGKLLYSNMPTGQTSGTICAGDDARLSDDRYPTAHAGSHSEGNSDELNLADLAGTLDQSITHDSPDTDLYENALHHTLGNGSLQAAAGDHVHDGVNGVLLPHSGLSGAGVNTHAQLDSHLADDDIHFTIDDGSSSLTRVYSSYKVNDLLSYKENRSNKGAPGGYAELDSGGLVPASRIPSSYKEIRVFLSIASRDAFASPYEGLRAHVLDASDDPTVDSGWAEYLYDGSSWSKTAEQESMDVVLDWSNIDNKPVSSTSAIDTAVGLAHLQNTDWALDLGGAHEVSANEARVHLDSPNPHTNHEWLSRKDAANGYAGLDSNGKLTTSKLYVGAGSDTVCVGNDPRLSDDRFPTAHILATNTGLGGEHAISGAAAGQVLRASSPSTANFQQLDHTDLGSIGTNTHDQIDTHMAAAAPHSGHALLVHQHVGGDITSAVAEAVNADTVDGLHAAAFSLTSHNHSLDSLSNTVITSNTVGELIRWDGSSWINTTLAEAGIEPAFAKNTAFNKNFGTIAGTVAEGNHGHDGSYITGTVPNADTVDGLHASAFSLTSHNHSLDSLSNVSISGNTTGELLRWSGTNWTNNTLAEAGIEPSFTKNTGFNKNFGTSAGTVAEGNHLHTKSQITDFSHTHSGGDIISAVAQAVNADTLDGYHATSFAQATSLSSYLPLSGGTMSGQITGRPSYGGLAVGDQGTPSFEVYGGGSGHASYMTFHRPGEYALKLGLDTNNVLSVGGWSMGAVSYVLWHSGNDGAGSGLDADLLDGNHASAFALASHTHTKAQITDFAHTHTKAQITDFAHTHSGGDIVSAVANATYASSAGNADTVDGYHASTSAASANTIPVRDANGYINFGWINTVSGEFAGTPTRIYASNDGYIRYMSPTNFFNNNAASVLTAVKSADGAGSGLDADTLDGKHASGFTFNALQGDWASQGTVSNVVGMLGWKNYGNNHVIFDASQSTTPSGSACNNSDPQVNWTGTYPTLMGWNGASTYGVRVDSCRRADSASTSDSATTATTADTALKIRTTAPASPTDGDIWMV